MYSPIDSALLFVVYFMAFSFGFCQSPEGMCNIFLKFGRVTDYLVYICYIDSLLYLFLLYYCLSLA